MPAPIKPPGKRINRITKTLGVVSTVGKAPRMPRGLCQQAQDAWRNFWLDVVSGAVQPADIEVTIRWVTNVDRYHRLVAEADREPIVVGSQGQPKPNALYGVAYMIESSIREDERQLGVGPLNRMRLGVAFSESAKSLAELNSEVPHGDDPRANLIELAGRRAGANIAPTPDDGT
jgi:P27 family predicted phage terminase small subunit